MEHDECDLWELKKDSNFCRHYTGNIFNQYQINNCKRYCSYYEAKKVMEEDREIDISKCRRD